MTSVTRRAGSRLCAAGFAAYVLSFGLSACSYLETQAQRTPTGDRRIVLDWQERRNLYAREIPKYRCPASFRLQCERGGAITYSCTCALSD